MVNTQVSRCTHPAILVILMLEIMHTFRILLCVMMRDQRAFIVGTIIHKQELPIRTGLGKDALNRLVDESFGVQENDDHRDSWWTIRLMLLGSRLYEGFHIPAQLCLNRSFN